MQIVEPLSQREGAAQVTAPCGCRLTDLVCRGARAPRGVDGHGQLQSPTQCACQQRRLVVAAPAQAARVQRDRQQQCRPRLRRQPGRHRFREPARLTESGVVLQCQYGFPYRCRVAERGPGVIERRPASLAVRTRIVLLLWQCAARTGRQVPRQITEAAAADTGPRRHRAGAQQAARRCDQGWQQAATIVKPSTHDKLTIGEALATMPQNRSLS